MKVFKKIGISLLSLVLIGCGSSNKESTVSQSISSTESKQSTELESKETSETKPKKKIVSHLTLDQISKERSLESKDSSTSEEHLSSTSEEYLPNTSEEHLPKSSPLDESILRAITYSILKNRVSSYDPLTETWEVISLDGRYLNGKYIDAPGSYLVRTEAYSSESGSQQSVYMLFTVRVELRDYIIHFLLIGDKTIEDDGYLEELSE